MRNTCQINRKSAAHLLGAGAALSLLTAAAPAAAAPFMTLGDVAAPPLAFLDFCVRHSDQCLIAQSAPAAKPAPSRPVEIAAPAEPVAALAEPLVQDEAPASGIFARHAGILPAYTVRLAAAPAAPAPLEGRGLTAWRARLTAPQITIAAVAAPPIVSPAVSAAPAPFWAVRTEASLAVGLAKAAVTPAPVSTASISLEDALRTVRAPEAVDGDGGMIRSTPQFLALLQQTNRSINGAIIKRDDLSARDLLDRWDLPLAGGGKPFGDCEDYVLEKRRALVQAGVSPRALSMAIARTRRGELHAVLVVTTDRGELVLDNLSPWVTPWSELNYTWIQRQVAGDAFKWAVING